MGIERFEDLHAWQTARKLVQFDETFECASHVSRLVKGSIDNLTAQITARRRDRGKGRNSP
jgi:hypothetical protein